MDNCKGSVITMETKNTMVANLHLSLPVSVPVLMLVLVLVVSS